MSVRIALLACSLVLAACSRNSAKRDSVEEPPVAPIQGPATAFPEVGVELIKPPGFEKADDFSGFIHHELKAEIRALAPPMPYQTVKAAFRRDAAPKGLHIESTKLIEIEGRQGLLLKAKQKAPDSDAVDEAWVVVSGTEHESRVVTATWPPAADEELSEELLRTVLSWKLIPVSDPLREITYRITPSDKLTQDEAFLQNQMLLYVITPGAPQRPGDPAFLVTSAGASVTKRHRQKFAEETLQTVKGLDIEKYTRGNPVTIDGLEGYELVGEGKSDGTSPGLIAYQVILFDTNDRQYTMLGLVGQPQRDEYLPEFEKMARSFVRNRKP